MTSTGPVQPAADEGTLFTRTRRNEAARIVMVGIIALLYWRGLAPVQVLLMAIA